MSGDGQGKVNPGYEGTEGGGQLSAGGRRPSRKTSKSFLDLDRYIIFFIITIGFGISVGLRTGAQYNNQNFRHKATKVL